MAIRSLRSLGSGDHSTDEDDEHCGKNDSCDGDENRRQPCSGEISSHVEAKSFAGTVEITDLKASPKPDRRHKSSTQMQNVLLPGAAVLLVVAVWWRGRSGRPMLRSTDASNVAALNRVQLSRVISEPETAAADQPVPVEVWQPPRTERECLELKTRLRLAMNGGPEGRLEAVRIAARWGSATVLPLLRRALRDSDSRVVEEAAAAIAPKRGATRRLPVQPARPPRNVARTR